MLGQGPPDLVLTMGSFSHVDIVWEDPQIAARVLAAAGPGEILVSRTVRDLVTGSDVVLEPRGGHHLKGVEGTWQLFTVGG